MAAFMMANQLNLTRKRRYLERNNPLDSISDDVDRRRFSKRYRFNPETVEEITTMVSENLKPETSRGRPISDQVQVLVTLRYLASNTKQDMLAQHFNIDQSTVSRIIHNTIDALSHHIAEFVRFPSTEEEKRTNYASFFAMAGFPTVAGLIDCTHVALMPPAETAHLYRNRKRQTTLNIQCVCDAAGKFTNVVARWPGSSHDSWVLRQSNLWTEYEAGRGSGLIVGDSGYPCRPWLMVPFLNPTTDAQRRYNSSLRRTRVLIEQVFGRWKRRFTVLHEENRMQPPSFVAKLAGVCAMLHNIAVDKKMPEVVECPNNQPNCPVCGTVAADPNLEEEADEEVDELDPQATGKTMRLSLVARCFS